MVPALVNWLLNVKPMDEEELAALAVPTLQHTGSAPKLIAEAKPTSGESENANPKGLRRALSARSLNGFLADLIRRTDEPADLKDKDAALPPKDKDRVAQP